MFATNNKQTLLDEYTDQLFHHNTENILFLFKSDQSNIKTAVVLLTTWVEYLDAQDENKLHV